MRGKEVASKALQVVPINFGANAALLDCYIFTAIGDWELLGVTEVHDVAGTDGSAVSLDIKKCASGTTIASGTSVLSSTFDMKSTADTPVKKTVSNGLATAPTRIIRDGESLAADFTGVLTALTGLALILWLRPLIRPKF